MVLSSLLVTLQTARLPSPLPASSPPHTARYFDDDSVGRACRYRPVVATELCPSVWLTR
jgi:hypothetical protein